jgi:hypothetical protein
MEHLMSGLCWAKPALLMKPFEAGHTVEWGPRCGCYGSTRGIYQWVISFHPIQSPPLSHA